MKPCPKCGVNQVKDAEWACKPCKAKVGEQVRAQRKAGPTLTSCPACKATVSSDAFTCPKCGHQFRSPSAFNLQDPVHVVGLFLMVGFVVAVIVLVVL